jgi:ATP-dependent Clp protease ATP-binding subunit ClpC
VFHRFDDDARLVVSIAIEEARRLRQGLIATEHILLGLLRIDPTLNLLEDLRVDPELVRTSLGTRAPSGETEIAGQIPFSTSSQRAFELSMESSMEMGHDSIAPEHMLMGLLREQTGLAGEILRELGLRPESLSDPGQPWWWRFGGP